MSLILLQNEISMSHLVGEEGQTVLPFLSSRQTWSGGQREALVGCYYALYPPAQKNMQIVMCITDNIKVTTAFIPGIEVLMEGQGSNRETKRW